MTHSKGFSITVEGLLSLLGQRQILLHLKQHILIQCRELADQFVIPCLKSRLLVFLHFLLVECYADISIYSDFMLELLGHIIGLFLLS